MDPLVEYSQLKQKKDSLLAEKTNLQGQLTALQVQLQEILKENGVSSVEELKLKKEQIENKLKEELEKWKQALSL